MKYLFIIILFLAACEKAEDINPVTPADSTYIIRYFVNSDSAYIQYNIDSLNYSHYVKKWDTTFKSFGGWYINIQVSTFGSNLTTGVVVNGDTVDGCIEPGICFISIYLE